MSDRLTIGYAGVAFASYYAEEHNQYGRAREYLTELAARMDVELVSYDSPIYEAHDAEAAAEMFIESDVDFLIVQNATCASGETLLPLTRVTKRLGLWGTPDPQLEGQVELHSLVSMNHFASIVRRYLRDEGVEYKWFFGEPGNEQLTRRLEVTLNALRGLKKMRTSRIGWIGGLSPGFFNMEFDMALLKQRFGTEVVALDMKQLMDRARAADPADVKRTSQELSSAAKLVLVDSREMTQGAALVEGMRNLVAEMDFDALAVQCWPTFQDEYDVAPCMAYGWMGSEYNIPVGCEGDVLGTVSMLMMNGLQVTARPPTLLDLTAFSADMEAVLMWHCGVSPRTWANEDGVSWVPHTTLGRKSENTYGVAGDMVFAAQPVTISYLSGDASELLILTADIVERPEKGFDGTRGWFTNFKLNNEAISVEDLVNTLVVRGQQHHYAVASATLGSELLEVAAWADLEVVTKVPYGDHMQRNK
ncbi:MAG: hypothetical protein GXP35_03230 [Actinobacteria bacterium]|nr:hypothetical protein [Actinomycetota bacterium]